jgi:tetratricopeptide (TPR) repeat protein
MNLFKKITPVLLIALLSMASINCGINKMVKNAGKINYAATPDPLELHGDSVKINVNGNFPVKYFHKKATLTVTPVVKYSGGEKTLKPIVMKGDKVEGSGQGISYTEGGKFSISDQYLYINGMEKSEVVIRAVAQYKKKVVNFPEIKLVEGTITTPLLLKNDFRTISVKDKFDKNPTVTQKSNIYFLVDSWEVRSVELKSDEMDNLNRFIDKAAKDSSDFKKLDVFGYASPEGELSRNSKLSENRADEAYKVMNNRFKKAKLTDLDKKEGFYSKITTNYEDWDGLKNMLQTSSISGKEQVLSIINTIGDPEAREAEFRKMASFDPISEAYFPKLRRAEINLIATLRTRSDDQIKSMSISSPDSLGMEELLYGANLQTTDDNKLAVYQASARRFPEDFRGFNNSGCVLLSQGKLNEAQAEFEKANKVSPSNPVIQNNLGAAAGMKGDRKGAAQFFAAAGNSPETSINKANLAVSAGKYAEAVSGYGTECSYNAALAKLLAGNASGATQTIDCSKDKDSADAHYLRALIAARSGNKDAVVSYLTKAISANNKFKEKAKNDLEFKKFATELSGVLN